MIYIINDFLMCQSKTIVEFLFHFTCILVEYVNQIFQIRSSSISTLGNQWYFHGPWNNYFKEFIKSSKNAKFLFSSVLLCAPISWQYIKSYKIVLIFQNYHGGFITRGGTLAGLAVNYEREINGGVLIEFTFLPVDGNNPLIKNGRDNDIQIKDIDSAGRSSKRRRTNEGPSNMDIFIK